MKQKGKRVYHKRIQKKFKQVTRPQEIAKTSEHERISISQKKPFGKMLSVLFSPFLKRKHGPKNEKGNAFIIRFRKAMSGWLKRHDSDMQLILFPLILLVILIILFVFNNQLFVALSKQQPITTDRTNMLNPYPYVQAIGTPIISAQAAIILDRGSQVILFSKNPLLRFSMASTTKIMTALVALDYYKPDDVLTVKTSNVPGSGLNLIRGEQFHFMDLMYAMLLPSANDAAQTIADNYPGGESEFVTKMNEKAQSLHLINTHYSDPIGLNDDGDYSTVVDMARLGSYAIASPQFVNVTSTKYRTIYAINSAHSYPLTNLNKLLGIDGVTGIKTGTTEGAGEVLVTSVVKKEHDYIIVVMDSSDRFTDTRLLLNFIDSNVKYVLPPLPVN